MTISKKNPKYQEFDVNKTVELPQNMQFVVYDVRPGPRTYHHAHKVVALGLDSNGEVTMLAFDTDSMSFNPRKWYSTRFTK